MNPSRLLLLTRPATVLDSTARAARRAGFRTMSAPLQTIHRLRWAPSGCHPEALLFTSANAPPLVANHLALLELPAWCVGRATAKAARRAGFRIAAAGHSDGSAVVAAAAAAGITSLWHIGGQSRAQLLVPEGLSITHHAVYMARLATALPARVIAALDDDKVLGTLLFSARAASCFAQLCSKFDLARRTLRVVALSPAIAKAAGDGWATLAVADRPTSQSAFAAAERLWQEGCHDQ